jgi:hypothetical protein
MLVVGREKRFRTFAEEGWKIISLRGTIRALSFNRTLRYRPVPAGVSIGHVKITAGTHGGVVEYQGKLHGISNSHIVTDHPERAEPPDRLEILQPAPYDKGDVLKDTMAFYVKHAKISLSEKSWCPVANLKDAVYNRFAGLLGRGTRSFSFTLLQEEENAIDAGIYEPVSQDVLSQDIVDDDGQPIQVAYTCGLLFAGSDVDGIMVACRADYIEKILGVKFLHEVKVPEVGETVWKSGRSTGLTFGEVIANDMTTSVDYNYGIGSMKHCIVGYVKCAGGDSGAPVVVRKA